MTAATQELRGLALLDAAIAHVEARPETWEQGRYRCATGMCLAGWTAVRAGGQWLVGDPEGWGADYLISTAEDSAGCVESINGRAAIDAHNRARLLLGITEEQASYLFAGCNSLADIRRVRDEIAAGAAS